jgi:inosine/xanthosine triphosphate pyrophosphatase family protein
MFNNKKGSNFQNQNIGNKLKIVKKANQSGNAEKEDAQKNAFNILNWDIRNFKGVNPELSPEETAKKFCEKWAGYKKEYGEGKIEELILEGSWRNAER